MCVGLIDYFSDPKIAGTNEAAPSKPMENVSLFFLFSLPCQRSQLNIIEECSSEYHKLGIFLLRDDNGYKIKRIEKTKHYIPDEIMTEMFQEWIKLPGDHSWKTLIKCLNKCCLNVLAKDIEDALRYNGVNI